MTTKDVENHMVLPSGAVHVPLDHPTGYEDADFDQLAIDFDFEDLHNSLPSKLRAKVLDYYRAYAIEQMGDL